MWLDIAMNEVPVAKKLQGARQLLKEMPDNNFVEGATGRIRILGDHIPCVPMISKSISALDE